MEIPGGEFSFKPLPDKEPGELEQESVIAHLGWPFQRKSTLHIQLASFLSVSSTKTQEQPISRTASRKSREDEKEGGGKRDSPEGEGEKGIGTSLPLPPKNRQLQLKLSSVFRCFTLRRKPISFAQLYPSKGRSPLKFRGFSSTLLESSRSETTGSHAYHTCNPSEAGSARGQDQGPPSPSEVQLMQDLIDALEAREIMLMESLGHERTRNITLVLESQNLLRSVSELESLLASEKTAAEDVQEKLRIQRGKSLSLSDELARKCAQLQWEVKSRQVAQLECEAMKAVLEGNPLQEAEKGGEQGVWRRGEEAASTEGEGRLLLFPSGGVKSMLVSAQGSQALGDAKLQAAAAGASKKLAADGSEDPPTQKPASLVKVASARRRSSYCYSKLEKRTKGYWVSPSARHRKLRGRRSRNSLLSAGKDVVVLRNNHAALMGYSSKLIVASAVLLMELRSNMDSIKSITSGLHTPPQQARTMLTPLPLPSSRGPAAAVEGPSQRSLSPGVGPVEQRTPKAEKVCAGIPFLTPPLSILAPQAITSPSCGTSSSPGVAAVSESTAMGAGGALSSAEGPELPWCQLQRRWDSLEAKGLELARVLGEGVALASIIAGYDGSRKEPGNG